ncbi:uncharacterized protein MONBRDRAFT_31693 [Monosiga brevicollis MX1]|uniref:SH3 domain-containing protein n=1 Tax=Monosiga brevicollis TaxID=81824 RepID=A9UV77_MONBE|nr:uncharacterized protein MONBRDRAFT_31693 [Monosiga brevicollis MX1]EDQ91032.1 predicted protein [Monosiga brevicollis MX1]|eukprot:XP_001744329.1 hypothetical protein [Monosiga brevicollis MX1]
MNAKEMRERGEKERERERERRLSFCTKFSLFFEELTASGATLGQLQAACRFDAEAGESKGAGVIKRRNFKKSWHPHTRANIEKVWIAEQKMLAEKSKTQQLQKELEEERAREELSRMAEDSGHRKREEKVEWMYAGAMGAADNRDEYLLGKPVDKTVLLNTKDDEDQMRFADRRREGVSPPRHHDRPAPGPGPAPAPARTAPPKVDDQAERDAARLKAMMSNAEWHQKGRKERVDRYEQSLREEEAAALQPREVEDGTEGDGAKFIQEMSKTSWSSEATAHLGDRIRRHRHYIQSTSHSYDSGGLRSLRSWLELEACPASFSTSTMNRPASIPELSTPEAVAFAGQRRQALFNYKKGKKHQVRLKEGDQLEILATPGNGWVQVKNLSRKTEGWCPSAYVSGATHASQSQSLALKQTADDRTSTGLVSRPVLLSSTSSQSLNVAGVLDVPDPVSQPLAHIGESDEAAFDSDSDHEDAAWHTDSLNDVTKQSDPPLVTVALAGVRANTASPPADSQAPPLQQPFARATFAFAPTHEDELALQPGLCVLILKRPDGGWWYGRAIADSRAGTSVPTELTGTPGASGWFPSNYVALTSPHNASHFSSDATKDAAPKSSAPEVPPPLLRRNTVTQLVQTRRNELNAAIEKELRLREGATKLLRTFHRASKRERKRLQPQEEEVAVTLAFANSNLQRLRTELHQLNDRMQANVRRSVHLAHKSLHATKTQAPEADRAPAWPMVALGLKETGGYTVEAQLMEVIHHHFGVTSSLTAGVQEQLLTTRKYDCFNGQPSSSSAVALEAAATLFNAASLSTHLAVACDLTVAEECGRAAAYFERAAGLVQFVAEEYNLRDSADLAPVTLRVIGALCLAQAQECLLLQQLAVRPRLAPGEAATVADMMLHVSNKLSANLLHGYLPPSWQVLCQIKAVMYEALADFWTGLEQLSDAQAAANSTSAAQWSGVARLLRAELLFKHVLRDQADKLPRAADLRLRLEGWAAEMICWLFWGLLSFIMFIHHLAPCERSILKHR